MKSGWPTLRRSKGKETIFLSGQPPNTSLNSFEHSATHPRSNA